MTYIAPRDTLVHESGGDCALRLTHVAFPKQELAIQVGHVDRVHVNDVHVFEAGQCQVFENLTPQTTRANAENLTVPSVDIPHENRPKQPNQTVEGQKRAVGGYV